MQTIIRTIPNIHQVFNEFDKVYAITSSKQQSRNLLTPEINKAFKPVFKAFLDNLCINYCLTYKNADMKEIKRFKGDSKNIVVCFSGGKDSTALIKHYLDKNYNVYLYHLKKINPPLWDECIQAQEIADYLHLPLYIDEIKLSGHHDYVEHPLKNMIIANGALQYGIREGIGTNIAFGNYITSSLESDNFEYCGGDDMEMWEIYNSIISTVIPGFKINIVLENLNETLETVCKDRELLDKTVSCLGRSSLRPHKHEWVKTKYGIELPKHRCGQCYKCCIEYIYMTDNDLQEYSKDYYKYCLNKLKQNVEAEDNIKYSEEEVWNHYFFYSMEKSKYYTCI